jgi:hypothetical protein
MSNEITEVAKALAEPARLAVEKLGAGISRLYEPTHVRCMERAKADAAYLRQLSKQDIEELKAGFEERESYRKARCELNLGLIADRVNERLHEDSGPRPSPPEDDWVDEFTEHAQHASNDQLRELWARIYTGEVRRPGAIPRRMLRLARDLDQQTAAMFHRACGCSFVGRARVIVAVEGWEKVAQLSIFDLKELQELNLMEVPDLKIEAKFETGALQFFDRVLRFQSATQESKGVQIFPFTRFGEALFNVSDPVPNEKYFARFTEAAQSAGWRYSTLMNARVNVT